MKVKVRKRGRAAESTCRSHIEDFAKVYGVYPNHKYDKVSYAKLVKKAQVPEYLVLSAAKEAAEDTIQAWHENKASYPVSDEIWDRLDRHIKDLLLAR